MQGPKAEWGTNSWRPINDDSRSQNARTFPLKQKFILIWLLLAPSVGSGIIFYSTGDPAHNTTAPVGAITNSGWQYEGLWGAYLGTPIAPKYFITATHIGGAVGQPF